MISQQPRAVTLGVQTCEQYWTEDTCGSSYGPFIVETTAQIRSDPSVTLRDFTLTNGNNVRHFCWPLSGHGALTLTKAVT